MPNIPNDEKFIQAVMIGIEPENGYKPTLVLPKWAQDWISQKGDPPQDIIDWMLSRPAIIQDLMIALPPACLVKATQDLHIPAPGTVGFIYSYNENGKVTVLQNPTHSIKAYCQPEWLEPVGYRFGLTPEKVREILGK